MLQLKLAYKDLTGVVCSLLLKLIALSMFQTILLQAIDFEINIRVQRPN